MKKCFYFILKFPFNILRILLLCMKWIFKKVFGLLFGWIPDLDKNMSGEEFEEYVQEILIRNGYKNVCLTKRSGDYGIDILASYKSYKYAIQCKMYAKPVGVAAVQQAYTGCEYYGCDKAVVVTNSTFTNQAKRLSESNGVILWNGEFLNKLKNRANSKSILRRREDEVVEVNKPYQNIIKVILDNGYASTTLLVEKLQIPREKAFYILEDLEYYNLVSKEDHLGIRDIYFFNEEEAYEQLN